MRPERYLAAMGLTILLAVPVVAQTTSPPRSPSAPAAAAPSTTGKSKKASELVDINSASPEELDKLPGVGPARTQAIIAGLPYNGKDDLINRKIISASVYNGIKNKIIARQK